MNLNIIFQNNGNPPSLLCDNESAMKLAENPEFHKKSKHIEISWHFTRYQIQNNKMQLVFVNTKDQLADGFTKGLNTISHKEFMDRMGLIKYI